MLKRSAADPPPLRGGDVGQRALEIRERDAPAGDHDHEREIAEATTEPRRQSPWQPRHGRGEGGDDQADRRRRSRAISMTMGMTDRTITTTTMM